jgi:hypothetical protein
LGCAATGNAVSVEPFHLHEVVHASVEPGTAFLEEGRAQLLDCRDAGNVALIEHRLSDEAMNGIAFYGEGNYDAAASFVSFLLDRAPAEAFRDMMSELDLDSSLEATDQAALRHYGQTIRSLRDEWALLPAEPRYENCRHAFECGEPELSNEPMVLVRGVSQAVARGGAVRTFSVSRETELHLTLQAMAPILHVGSCDRRAHPGDWRSTAGSLEVRIRLAPGNYYLWLTGLLPDPGDSEGLAEITVEGLE